MVLVIGTENCSRCNMTKNILNNKNIVYDYKLIDSLTSEEQNKYLDIAQQNGQMSYPLIFKDEVLTTLQKL